MFVPGLSGTRAENAPPATETLLPRTKTLAAAGETLPLTAIESLRTRVPSAGDLSCRRTCGAGVAAAPQAATPPAHVASATAQTTTDRADAKGGGGRRPERASCMFPKVPVAPASWGGRSRETVRHNVPVSELAVGIDFAGCRVEERIGRGGMGVVYRGTDLRLGRPVAIKLIASEYATDAAVRRRFEREAQLMAAIDHPNVIPVYAAGEQDGHLYLVMRYVPGTDLHGLLREDKRLPPRQAAHIADELAKALDAAHACGLVHRDIKPANVLLDREHVYLTDFGITRAVDSGTHATDSNGWVGTVDFMSPEHLRGEMTDARSDVYSLGCLLYTCLTGSPPFHRDSAAATILAQIEDSPPPASLTEGVPRQFDAVISRALAKRPGGRYQSAGELGRAAQTAAEGHSFVTRPRRFADRLVGGGENGGRARQDQATTILLRRNGAAAQTAVRPRRAATRTRVKPSPSPPVNDRSSDGPTRYRSRLRHRSLALAAGLLTVLGATGVVLAARTTTPSGPLSSAEVASAAQAFAAAYGHRDATGLSRLLAVDVARISPTAAEHGRPAVLAEYRRQFRANPIQAYELQGMVVSSGWVGRDQARYTVRLAGRSSIAGTVVFGVERVGGRVVIGLITTQPSG